MKPDRATYWGLRVSIVLTILVYFAAIYAWRSVS